MSKEADIPINQIICGDCLEVMKGWPDGCVDLVLTDPPYGIKQNAHRHYSRTKLARTTAWHGNWDDHPMSPQQQSEIMRLSLQQVIFGGNYFVLPTHTQWIIWDKDNGASNFGDCELIWTSFSGAIRKFRYRWNGMIQEEQNWRIREERYHPTQKPTKVLIWLLKRYSKPHDLILDPFCGSGTTCVAAKMLGRRYIGIDISEEYCQIARERLDVVDTGVPVKEARQGQMAMFRAG